MTDEKKPAKKPATPKSAPAAKTATKPAAPAKKAAAKPAAKTGAVLMVKQIGSPARSEDWAYQTLKGLGLGRLNRTRTLEDTPAVRGMIARVHHLVKIQDAA